MNATEQVSHAGPDGPPGTPDQTQREALSDVTARLAAALAAPDDFPRLVQALGDNRRLWVRIAFEVADEGSGVPLSLQEQIRYLAEFTQRHTSLVLGDKATPEVLVDINTALLRGFAGQLLASPPAQPMVYQ